MTIDQDAQEFGLHIKQGGWRLGLLVARNVEKGNGNGQRKDRGERSRRDHDGLKISASEFARKAGTTNDRVLRHLEAWRRAWAAGHVPNAEDLSPGVEIDLDAETLPEWGEFYEAGKTSTDDSVRRSKPSVVRNIQNDPEFAAAVSDALAEHRPEAIAKHASRPGVAQAIASDKQARTAASRAIDDHYQQQATERQDRTERKASSDTTDRAVDGLLWVNRLGEACERFSREGNEALRQVGALPDSERYWLTGAIDRAEATVRAARRYLELGKSEFDAELEALLESEG